MLELEPEDIIKLFHGFEVKPAYLSRFALDLDENLLQTELDLTKTAVVTSPNFPNAGKGLVNMSGTVEKDVSFPYWGQIFLHNQYDSQLHNVNLDENIKCRFIAPLFQPFLSKHLKLYLAGSLSCAATYCNDATSLFLSSTFFFWHSNLVFTHYIYKITIIVSRIYTNDSSRNNAQYDDIMFTKSLKINKM